MVSLIKDAFRPHSHLLSADAKIGGKNLVCCSDIALDLKLIFFFFLNKSNICKIKIYSQKGDNIGRNILNISSRRQHFPSSAVARFNPAVCALIWNCWTPTFKPERHIIRHEITQEWFTAFPTKVNLNVIAVWLETLISAYHSKMFSPGFTMFVFNSTFQSVIDWQKQHFNLTLTLNCVKADSFLLVHCQRFLWISFYAPSGKLCSLRSAFLWSQLWLLLFFCVK